LRKIASYLILFLFGIQAVIAQVMPEKGVPFLENFTPAQYHNKGKIWNIQTAPNGMVYMAADKGLLEFDGKIWNSFTGSKGFTRSLLVVSDSLIYTGSDLDFGVWKKNAYQGFDYSSLYPFQEDLQEVSEEFWHVNKLNNSIVFASSQSIYLYRNQQLVKIVAPSGFTGSFSVNDSLYFADQSHGLFILDEFSLRNVFEYPDNTSMEIMGMYYNSEGLVIVTRDMGLYQFVSGKLNRLGNTLSENIRMSKVFSFEPIGQTHVAFGTVLKGLFIADSDGKIIHQINRHKGLPSNTVLALHYSQAGKLWLGMDYGVSSLDLNNHFTYFFDYRGDFGTGYTALLKEEDFLLGTNQGLYHSHWEGLNNNLEYFRVNIVPNTEGQVWTLENIDNTLFMGHDKGLFVVKENRVEQVSDQEGVWTILRYKDYLLTGNYNGISIFQEKDNKWTFLKKMELILGSCNQLIIEKDNILWINIPTFGIIRAVLNDDLYPEEREIFPVAAFDGADPFLLVDENGLQVVTSKSQFVYSSENQKFTARMQPVVLPKPEGLLPGINKSVTLSPDYEFFPVFNGFSLKYRAEREPNKPMPFILTLRKIEAYRNHERMLIRPGEKVPYHFNNFRIVCIVPNQDNVLYQYRLDNQGEWSSWISENSFDLSGLKHGEHQLMVRASVQGALTEKLTVTFRVIAPWYSNWYAYVIYFLLVLAIIFLMVYWQKQMLKKQADNMLAKEQNALREQAEKHKEEMHALEQERLQTDFEILKHQLKSKTIELANKAKDSEEKTRVILSLKEICEKAQKNPAIYKQKLTEMHRILDSFLNVEDKTFEIQMDELHQDFFKKLKDKFPGLSSNDLRLCAYLKIGLNSKEIADILNIQPSSSYISRSRLRKKLNLKSDENFYDFLNSI
jgi:DNA-binding CsgD family transcriptional regulator